MHGLNIFNFLALNFILLLFSGCIEKKEINAGEELSSKSEIIHSLNTGNHEKALFNINKSLGQNVADEELLFYKACALAMRAGVDVFALYPLLEMKLFKESMIDWDNLKKYENPYKRFFSIESKEKIKVILQEKLVKKLRGMFDFFERDVQQVTVSNLEVFYKIMDKVSFDLQEQKRDEKFATIYKLSDRYRELRTILTRLQKTAEAFEEYNNYQSVYENRLKDELLTFEKAEEDISVEDNKESLDSTFDGLIAVQQNILGTARLLIESIDQAESSDVLEEENYEIKDIEFNSVAKNSMNIMWGMYQALPLISMLPVIKDGNAADIDQALTILSDLLHANTIDIAEKARQYMSFLSALSLMNTMKKSIMIDRAVDPYHFVCNFDEEKIFDTYHNLRKYMDYLIMGLSSMEISNDFFFKLDKLFMKLEKEKGVLSLDTKNMISSSVSKIKREMCQ